jgi:hypothetical protein
VFKRVSEDRDELSIVFRLAGKKIGFAIACEEDSLRRTSTSVGLNPRSTCAVYSAMPESNGIRPQSGGWNLDHNAADVSICEEIDARELEVVEGALCIEKEGVTSPAGKEAVVAGLCHVCRLARRDQRPLDDQVTAVACSGGLRAVDTIDGSGLRTAVGRREPDPVRYVGDRITIGVDLEFVDRIRCEGLGCSGSRGLTPIDGCTFITKIVLFSFPGLGKT